MMRRMTVRLISRRSLIGQVRVFEPLPPRLNCFLRRGEGISNHRRRVSI